MGPIAPGELALYAALAVLAVALFRRFRPSRSRPTPIVVNPFVPTQDRPTLVDLFVEHEDSVRLARRRAKASDKLFDITGADGPNG